LQRHSFESGNYFTFNDLINPLPQVIRPVEITAPRTNIQPIINVTSQASGLTNANETTQSSSLLSTSVNITEVSLNRIY